MADVPYRVVRGITREGALDFVPCVLGKGGVVRVAVDGCQ